MRKRLWKQLWLVWILLGGAIILWPGPVQAQEGATLESANQAYSDGHYAEAATAFRQIIATQGTSAALCFNLGNAEARAGHSGPAMLQYERARYLAPHDAEIDHNLQLTRQKAGLKPNSYRWWEAMLRSLDWNVLFGLVTGGLGLIVLAILTTGFSASWAPALRLEPPALRRMAKAVLFLAVPVTLACLFIEVSAVGFANRIEAVVTHKDAVLRLSPFESAEQIGALPEGELVTVEQRHNDYLRIEARDKKYGWIKDTLLEPIVPGSLDVPK